MSTPLIGKEMKKIEKSHGCSLDHWVGGLMHITVQTHYDIKYLTMHLSVYMNATPETSFITLRHGTKYLMYHPHKPIVYSRKEIKVNDR